MEKHYAKICAIFTGTRRASVAASWFAPPRKYSLYVTVFRQNRKRLSERKGQWRLAKINRSSLQDIVDESIGAVLCTSALFLPTQQGRGVGECGGHGRLPVARKA